MKTSELLMALCKPDIISGVIECGVRLLLSADFRKYCFIVATFVWLRSGHILELHQRFLIGPTEPKPSVRNQRVIAKKYRRKKTLREEVRAPLHRPPKHARQAARRPTK